MASLAANRHPRATHQWLLMGIQVCRLPALLQPTGTPGPHTPGPHINGFLWATHQWLLLGVQVCRLPALKPLKRSKRLKRSKPLQTVQPVKRWLRVLPLAAISYPGHTSMASSGHSCSQPPPQGHTSMASYGHSCSQQAPQGHTSMASYGHPSLPFASSLAANRHPRATHQWLLLGVQVCRLPALKPLKRSKRLKRQTLTNRTTRKTLASRASSCSHHQLPWPHINGFFWPLLQPTATPFGFLWPSCSQQAPRATHQWLLMGILCRLPALLQPTGTPRATHQWLLMGHTQWLLLGVQVCRLPALKPLKRSKRLKRSKPLQTVQPVKRWLRVLPLAAISYPAAINGFFWPLLQPTATPRPHINGFLWPLLPMGIQVCRLPALLQPTGTPGPHINGFFWASKSAVCPP